MTAPIKKPKQTRQDLEREVRELEAQIDRGEVKP